MNLLKSQIEHAGSLVGTRHQPAPPLRFYSPPEGRIYPDAFLLPAGSNYPFLSCPDYVRRSSTHLFTGMSAYSDPNVHMQMLLIAAILDSGMKAGRTSCPCPTLEPMHSAVVAQLKGRDPDSYPLWDLRCTGPFLPLPGDSYTLLDQGAPSESLCFMAACASYLWLSRHSIILSKSTSDVDEWAPPRIAEAP